MPHPPEPNAARIPVHREALIKRGQAGPSTSDVREFYNFYRRQIHEGIPEDELLATPKRFKAAIDGMRFARAHRVALQHALDAAGLHTGVLGDARVRKAVEDSMEIAITTEARTQFALEQAGASPGVVNEFVRTFIQGDLDPPRADALQRIEKRLGPEAAQRFADAYNRHVRTLLNYKPPEERK